MMWLLVIERDGEPAERWPALVKWAAFGLAVIGVAAIIMWRLWSR